MVNLAGGGYFLVFAATTIVSVTAAKDKSPNIIIISPPNDYPPPPPPSPLPPPPPPPPPPMPYHGQFSQYPIAPGFGRSPFGGGGLLRAIGGMGGFGFGGGIDPIFGDLAMEGSHEIYHNQLPMMPNVFVLPIRVPSNAGMVGLKSGQRQGKPKGIPDLSFHAESFNSLGGPRVGSHMGPIRRFGGLSNWDLNAMDKGTVLPWESTEFWRK